MWSMGQNIRALKEAEEIYWFGLDFSSAKMIGTDKFLNRDLVLNSFIHQVWNDLIFKEKAKFDVGKACDNKKMIQFKYVVEKRNRAVTMDNLFIDWNYKLSLTEVESMLKQYPSLSQGSIGLVFIVESFDSRNKRANIWVCFVDLYTQEPLVAQRYSVKKGTSVHLKNAWINSFDFLIDDLDRDFNKVSD